MNLLFVDESGTVPNPTSSKRYFVIGGVIVTENSWKSVKQQLDQIKTKYQIKGEIKWRYFSPSNTDRENSIQHLDWDSKNAVRNAILAIITRTAAVKSIAVVTSVPTAYSLFHIKDADDLYHFTYKALTERFQYHLQECSALGIVVCDHRGPKDDKRLRALHQKLLDGGGEQCSNYKNLIEGLFVAPSHYSIGIQLADMVAGAVYRKFMSNDPKFFEQLKSSFRTSSRGEIDGYGLIRQPKAGWA